MKSNQDSKSSASFISCVYDTQQLGAPFDCTHFFCIFTVQSITVRICTIIKNITRIYCFQIRVIVKASLQRKTNTCDDGLDRINLEFVAKTASTKLTWNFSAFEALRLPAQQQKNNLFFHGLLGRGCTKK